MKAISHFPIARLVGLPMGSGLPCDKDGMVSRISFSTTRETEFHAILVLPNIKIWAYFQYPWIFEGVGLSPRL